MGDFASGGLALPIGLAFGNDTNLYVASFSNNRVVRFNGITGALIGNFVTAGTTGLSGPNFMLFHDFGPPRIESIMRTSEGLVLSWNGRPDTQLQYTTNLAPTEWQPVAGTLGASSITNSSLDSAGFYRLVRD